MGYRIYAGDWLIHDDALEELRVFSPKLSLEVNTTGSFTFSIYPENIYYSKIAKLKTIITLYQDESLLFRGRVLNEDIGFYNEKLVTCEGELAFLLDSIQRPYDFTGSITEYLSQMITRHNEQVEEEKRFTLGAVTVTDPNDYIVRSNIDHVNTWEEINKKLIENLGGYIQTRHENGITYLDYLKDFERISSQAVEFGKNLIDLKKIRKGEDIATALIPLGAKIKDDEGKDTDKRLTIEAVNNGSDFIYNPDAVEQFGWIFETEIWDDVTDAGNLLTKAREHLSGLVDSVELVELSAADLAKIDKTVGAFRLGTYVRVISKPHGIDQLMMVTKIDIDLFNPAGNKLTLGGTVEGFSKAIQGISDEQGIIYRSIDKVAENANKAVYNTEQNLMASIEVSQENILSTVSEKCYLKDETDRLVSEVSSKLEQSAEGWEMQFTRFNAALEDVANGTDAEFELIRKYIRFVDGSILLGEEGNSLELKISNDRISFMQGGSEVAYFSDNRLFVTDGHFINSLQLGNFAFIPRTNGNLSFKKLDADNESVAGLAVAGKAVIE